MTVITDSQCALYQTPGHPEKPARVLRTRDLLKQQRSLDLLWDEPESVSDACLLRGHSPGHLERLKAGKDFDADTPWHPDIDAHARRGVGGAVRAMRLALEDKPAFSLLRPPGHHATGNRAMGFCYLSSMALAVLEARETGVQRISVMDFDVHHGNGTEDLLRDVEGVQFISVHQHPCYPGTGTGPVGNNCWNYPVEPNTPREDWRRTLQRGLDQIREYQPDLIGVSAGFDAYAMDPLANGTLTREDFYWLGDQFRQMNRPVFHILEGGYSVDLPDLVLHYLLGYAGKPS